MRGGLPPAVPSPWHMAYIEATSLVEIFGHGYFTGDAVANWESPAKLDTFM